MLLSLHCHSPYHSYFVGCDQLTVLSRYWLHCPASATNQNRRKNSASSCRVKRPQSHSPIVMAGVLVAELQLLWVLCSERKDIYSDYKYMGSLACVCMYVQIKYCTCMSCNFHEGFIFANFARCLADRKIKDTWKYSTVCFLLLCCVW